MGVISSIVAVLTEDAESAVNEASVFVSIGAYAGLAFAYWDHIVGKFMERERVEPGYREDNGVI